MVLGESKTCQIVSLALDSVYWMLAAGPMLYMDFLNLPCKSGIVFPLVLNFEVYIMFNENTQVHMYRNKHIFIHFSLVSRVLSFPSITHWLFSTFMS